MKSIRRVLLVLIPLCCLSIGPGEARVACSGYPCSWIESDASTLISQITSIPITVESQGDVDSYSSGQASGRIRVWVQGPAYSYRATWSVADDNGTVDSGVIVQGCHPLEQMVEWSGAASGDLTMSVTTEVTVANSVSCDNPGDSDYIVQGNLTADNTNCPG